MLTLLVIAPFAERVQQAERQRQAVWALGRSGGLVYYVENVEDSDEKLEPSLPEWLTDLFGLDFF